MTDPKDIHSVAGRMKVMAEWAQLTDVSYMEAFNAFGSQAFRLSTGEDPHPYSRFVVGRETFVTPVYCPPFFESYWKNPRVLDSGGALDGAQLADGARDLMKGFAHSLNLENRACRVAAGRGVHRLAEGLYGAWKRQLPGGLEHHGSDEYLVAMLDANPSGYTRLFAVEGDLDNFFDEDVLGRLPRNGEQTSKKRILTTVLPRTSFLDFSLAYHSAREQGIIQTFPYEDVRAKR